MLRSAASSSLGLLASAAAILTLAGTLAPILPQFEMLNHFRPFMVAGFAAMLAAALLLRVRSLVYVTLAFTALNAALLLAPLSVQAEAAPRDAGERIKLITFNLFAGNHDFPVTEQFLRGENADIVVLQEVTHEHADQLLESLRDLYPHQIACARTVRCGLAILSKRAWTAADFAAGDRERPPLVWARFGSGDTAFRVAATHFVTPFRADYQAHHAAWLVRWRRSVAEELILAGDFNLTPYSWRLNSIAWATGLSRYATYQASWPALEYRPAFLIDHIFSSDGFRPLDVRTGPDLGSDHLPVIAEIARVGGPENAL